MTAKRVWLGFVGAVAVVGVVVGGAISSAGAQAPASPTLVSATILANNFKQGEMSTVQFTFTEPVKLNGPASSYLSDFTLGANTHPTAATVESSAVFSAAQGIIVEADFPASVNVGLFESASVATGAVVSASGGAPNAAGSARLTITTEGATSGPDLRGADFFNVYTTIPQHANWIEYFFDKPIESVVPSDFGYYAPGSTTPTMGTSVPSGGFAPGTTSVTIEFPGNTAASGRGIFVLRGAATGKTGRTNPASESLADGGGNVSGLPGLLSASSENVASVTQASATTYDFTFNEAPTTVTPSDFLVYTKGDGEVAGATDTASGQTVAVTFPVGGGADVVRSAVLAGAVTVNGVANNVGSQPIGPAAGFFTGTAANRGVGFIPTGPSIKNSPATIRDAPCGPGDHPETGLQGQVPASVRSAFTGFNCNLTELAQWPSAGVTWHGGTWVGAWAGDCVYLSTAGYGVYVIDASNPAHPVEKWLLHPPAFLNTWETLKYNPQRHLLAATSFENPYLAIYDVSDCAHPVVDARWYLGPISKGHAGNWAPDGNTYYQVQDYRGVGNRLLAIDTSDPHHPKVLARLSFPGNGRPHDLSFNPSGTIIYMQQPGQFGNLGASPGPNGLVTMDFSQIQHRIPHPKVHVISTLFWNNGGQAQQTLPVTYNGRPYVITTDEVGSGGVGGRGGACARGLSPFGFPQIINVNNPKEPFIVSKLRLQVDDPTKCAINDDAPDTAIFGYDSHYCNVNRLNNPTMLACGQFEAGMRLYDISNPSKPSEIGYFNPPPGHDTTSEHRMFAPSGATQTDWASSPPVFVGCDIWDQFQDNGYLFLKITHGPAKQLCTVDSSTADSSLQ